ncbi:MAG TPA: LacI family transcriptional regulator [Firmicutes bacterium]|nr:LacI family transcriptional regulator [Bacillota bacterium]
MTIRDVARRAGVSVATVSAVLNQNKYVSEQLKERVQRAVEELGYQPNRLARSLRRKKSSMVAYIVPTITNPIFSQVARGVQDVMSQASHSVILCNSDLDPKKFEDYRSILLESQIDGLILSAAHDPATGRVVEAFNSKGVPVVIVHSPRDLEDVDSILPDDHGGAVKAVEHLVALGHRRIGIVGVKNSTSSRLRVEGYKEALEKAGIPLDDRLIYLGESYADEYGYKGCQALLQVDPPPTAIFAVSDLLGIKVLSAAADMGLRVPEDISIVAFDNTFAAYSRPQLTSVSVPNYEMGQVAARLLLGRLRRSESELKRAGKAGSPSRGDRAVRKLFDEELVVRASTGPCRAS